jgi:hypothetical protein
MELRLIAEDNDLDIKLKKRGEVYVSVYDGCQTHKIFEGESINTTIIESSIVFAEGGFFEPSSGLGVYMGTKRSVDDIKKKLEL